MRLTHVHEQLAAFRREVARKWSKLTKADLESVDCELGSLSEIVAKRYSIPARQARQQAEAFLDGFGTTFREAVSLVGEASRDLWRNGRHHVNEAVHSGAEKAGDLLQTGRDQLAALRQRTGKLVGDHPLTSIAVAAGAGVLLALLLRRR